MDQLTHSYDNTVSDSYFSFNGSQSGVKSQDMSEFLLAVMSTLEVRKLMSLYYQQLLRFLPVTAVKLVFSEGCLAIGESQPKHYKLKKDCVVAQQRFASLHYSFYESLDLNDQTLLQQLHHYFSTPLKNAFEHQRVKQLATHDNLTNLYNRSHFQDTLKKMISSSQRTQCSFGLLVIDLNNFKQINDNLGHQQGDKVLQAAAQTIQGCLRESDYAFRWGGDEFCCLLPNSCDQGNARIVQRIHDAFAAEYKLAFHQVTCSIGSAIFDGNDTGETLIARADAAMYSAKNSGNNRVKAA